MSFLFRTSSMRVSGTPQRPNPPHRSVEFGFMSFRASEAEGRTLLISWRRAVEANVRARRIDCYVLLVIGNWERNSQCPIKFEAL